MTVEDVKDFDSLIEWLHSIGRADLTDQVSRSGPSGFVAKFPVIVQMYKAYEMLKTRH